MILIVNCTPLKNSVKEWLVCLRILSAKQIQRLLQKRYGDDLFFANVCGRKNVICFRNMAKCIINDKWYAERDSDINNESIRIVQAAAKLVKSEIRESLFQTDQYPSNCHIEDKGCAKQWVPPLLQTFLGSIIGDEIKQIAIGHCIVQASRPRSVISPVLFGV